MRLSFALLSTALLLCLPQCSNKEIPFSAGTMKADDPEATSLYNEAKSLYQEGSLSTSIKRSEKLLKHHPIALEAPEAQLLIAECYWQKGDPVDAFNAYNNLITRYPTSPLYKTALQKQVDLAFGAAEGKVTYKFLWMLDTPIARTDVVDMLTKVKENAPSAPTAPQSLLKLGLLYDNSDAPEKAIEAYHGVVDHYATSTEAPYAQMAVGNNLLKRMNEGNKNPHNLKAAQEAFEDFIQRYPKHELIGQANEKLNYVRWRLASLNLEIADFYLRSHNQESAIFYYQEAAHNRYNKEVAEKARAQLKELGITPKAPYPVATPEAAKTEEKAPDQIKENASAPTPQA